MTSSFTKKRIQVWLTLGQGTFGAEKGNTTIIDGLRVECEIEKGGHPSKNKCKLRIYGVLEHDMIALTRPAFAPLAVRKNLVKVLAGDTDPLPTAFMGEVTGAWAVYRQPPNLYFHVEALEGYYPAVAPSQPKSYAGSASVAQLMEQLATEMGYTFENNGVTTALAYPYLSGSAYTQATQLADAANIEFGVDDGVLFIAPRGASRGGLTSVPLISAETGMKDYPTFDSKGLHVECLYNADIKLGGPVKIESQLAAASGIWRVNAVRHHLEAENPGGKWITKFKAARIGG